SKTNNDCQIKFKLSQLGFIYTGPSYAADAAPVRPWLRVDHVPQAPFARNAGEEIDMLRVCRLHDAGIDVADLVLSHQRHCLRPQQPDPGPAPRVSPLTHARRNSREPRNTLSIP